ncbi:MAG TPA: DUF4397 domain-containing protein [Usitatibacter sp.]|nr:DUF4397 domain-containing protein [Usitatibacter sp.]
MKITWLVAVVAALALVSGCKGSHNQNSTSMRAIQAVPDAEPLDVLVDTDVKASALTLGQTSSVSQFDSGTRDVQIRSSTSQSILSDKQISFSSGVTSTLIVFGKRAAINTQLLVDDTTAIDSGQLRIRLVNLAGDSGPVDLYLTQAGQNISTSPVIIPSTGFGSASGSVEIAPASLAVTITSAGTQDILFTSAPQTFAAGSYVTIFVVPTLGGKLVNVSLVNQTSGGTFLQNTNARVKAVNGIIDSTNVNFRMDGSAILVNVPLGAGSSYITTASGQHTLTVEPSTTPGSPVASLPVNLQSARDYSALSIGTLAQAALVTFLDDNSLPATGFCKIRFVNGLSDNNSVDVQLNFATQVSQLPPATASTYFQVAPSITYTITYTTGGGVQVIGTLTPIELDTPGVYTSYVVGTANNAKILVVRER